MVCMYVQHMHNFIHWRALLIGGDFIYTHEPRYSYTLPTTLRYKGTIEGGNYDSRKCLNF